MSDQALKEPFIRQGWLRVILIGAAFGLLTLLLAVPAVVNLAGVRWEDIRSAPIATLSGLLKGEHLWLMLVLECVMSLIAVIAFRLFIDRKPLASLGISFSGFESEALIGLLTGPVILGLTSLVLRLSGHLQWTDITLDGNALFISFGMMMLIALGEELLFRGYILDNLLDTLQGSKWTALAISALLFAFFHITNPGMNTVAFANMFLAGLLLGLNYIFTRNLWFAFTLHLSWNYFQGPILGLPVSGMTLPSLFVAETNGDQLITGGEFGLEGSIINTAVSITAIMILAWAFARRYEPMRSSIKA